MIETDKIVILALGNRFRGDDAAGLEVATRLNRETDAYTIIEGADDALAIMDAWHSAALAIVVDAAVTGGQPGTVHRVEMDSGLLPKDMSRCSSHGLGVAEAMELSKAMGRLPRRLIIYGIEARSMALGEPLSPELAEPAERVARKIEADVASLREA